MIVTLEQLLNGLQGGTWEWRNVSDIKPGDRVSWWTQAAEVISNTESTHGYNLTVYDAVEQKQSTFVYQHSDQLHVRIKDLA